MTFHTHSSISPFANALRLSVLFYILLSLSACSDSFVYSDQQDISNAQWTYADTVKFIVPTLDTTQRYDLYLDVEHRTDYPYQNIYMNVSTRYPSGKEITELLPIDLADKTGKWYGKCNSEQCHLRINIQENAYFNEAGAHHIKFEQYMRESPLAGVQSIALHVAVAENQR